jgi:2-oxoisovalerate ferredoxin oxidoreductase beta subunit
MDDKSDYKVLKRPEAIYSEFTRKGGTALKATHYCPGCGHGIVHKLIAEAISDLGIQDRCVMLSPVGCTVFAYYYFDCGNVQASHGRAPAVGTGISRACDDAIVISYQGDGDLASIGLNETMQAANRGEKMAVFFVNNTVYGMTGGQMAPTTLVDQKTITCPNGRDSRQAGYPLHMCELINQLKAPVYIERVSVSDIAHVRKARKAIRKAMEIQRAGKGYSFVEILTSCPVNLRLNAADGADFVNTQMEKEFPTGLFRDNSQTAEPFTRMESDFRKESIDAAFELDTDSSPEPVIDESFGEIDLKIAGFGGQGVLSLGLITTIAACRDGRFVSWFPSYGPEQRGGTSNCSIVISGKKIGSPDISEPDVLIAMNRPSFDKFAPKVKRAGLIIYDSLARDAKMPEGVRCVEVPATELAKEHGSQKLSNIFLLAAMIQTNATRLTAKEFKQGIKVLFEGKEPIVSKNYQMLETALKWAKSNLK